MPEMRRAGPGEQNRRAEPLPCRLSAQQERQVMSAVNDSRAPVAISSSLAELFKAPTSSLTRQGWLERVVAALRDLFKAKGYVVPASVRVSIGWPRGSHGRGRAIGQCWAIEASSDKYNEIFISPELGSDSIEVIGVLTHELVHAVVGTKAGHKRPFKQCAEAVGLVGKMTSTKEGDELRRWASARIDEIGKYPAGSLALHMRQKQTTRLIKCECGVCGYVARVARKWIDDVGAPICPLHPQEMDVAR
jgi:hypothetical protein